MMVKRESRSISSQEQEKSRPPVVAVLGHVDHGKTTLLDKIRQTNAVASEAGGITQHIGAYQISFTSPPTTYNPQPTPKVITFIDTPGHAAFSQMRSRGAKVADLVVLVVAVDEGVKPQTLESLKYIQTAKIPYLVALTKIDLPNTNIERVKKDLSKNGIVVEGHGGEVVAVPVSAKTGKGTQDLLEMILILAEMAELKGNPKNPFQGVVVESKLDPQRGATATILVRDGNLKVGEAIKIEEEISKIRAMFDENGKRVSLAGPSVPVEVLGFREVPPVGAEVTTTETQNSDARQRDRSAKTQKFSASPRLQGKYSGKKDKEAETEKLEIVLKADVTGSLEAVIDSLPAEVEIIAAGVGTVNESDVLLADTTGALIVAFNTKIPLPVRKLATAERVKILSFKVIYELLKEIEIRVLKKSQPAVAEKVIGRAKILKEFKARKDRVAGCRVVEGRIEKTDRLQLMRGKEVVGEVRISSMKSGQEDVSQAKEGEEFGAILSPPLDFNLGDMLVSFHKVEES